MFQLYSKWIRINFYTFDLFFSFRRKVWFITAFENIISIIFRFYHIIKTMIFIFARNRFYNLFVIVFGTRNQLNVHINYFFYLLFIFNLFIQIFLKVEFFFFFFKLSRVHLNLDGFLKFFTVMNLYQNILIVHL